MPPEFLTNVFLLSAISSVTFGVIGSFVVARRIGYLTGAISHSAFGGVGFGLWLQQIVTTGAFGALALAQSLTSAEEAPSFCAKLGAYIDPCYFAVLFAILAALLVDYIRRHGKEREETLLGTVWAVGMALGFLFFEKIDGYASPTTYLFGDILLVSKTDVYVSTILSALILFVVFCDFKRLEAVCFDEEHAQLRGVNVGFQNRLLLVLTSLAVVIMLRAVGMALIVALLTLPAATASRFTKRLSSTIVLATVVCFVGSWLGIVVSYAFNLTTGSTIILIVAAFYLTSLAVKRR